MALQGTLDTFALPDVLRLLESTKKTGCLHLQATLSDGDVWLYDGGVVGARAAALRDGTAPVDVIFQLLRSEEGSFSFEQDAMPEEPNPPIPVEALLGEAQTMLDEWKEIEKIVPSQDCWVRLVSELGSDEIVVSGARWRTLVAVGSGATVRRVGEMLDLAEVPVCRAVKDLVESGLAEVGDPQPSRPPQTADSPVVALPDDLNGAPTAPAGDPVVVPGPAAPAEEFTPMVFDEPEVSSEVSPEVDTPNGETVQSVESADSDRFGANFDADDDFLADVFPGLSSRKNDQSGAAVTDAAPPRASTLSERMAGADMPSADAPPTGPPPGVAAPVDLPDPAPLVDAGADPELSRQLANLSPKAAAAVRAAAAAATDEEREAALEAVDEDDETINRGLLLKFLGSVRS